MFCWLSLSNILNFFRLYTIWCLPFGGIMLDWGGHSKVGNDENTHSKAIINEEKAELRKSKLIPYKLFMKRRDFHYPHRYNQVWCTCSPPLPSSSSSYESTPRIPSGGSGGEARHGFFSNWSVQGPFVHAITEINKTTNLCHTSKSLNLKGGGSGWYSPPLTNKLLAPKSLLATHH